MNKKNIFISLVALSLISGLLFLFYEPFLQGIVSLISSLFHRELDFSFWKIGFKKTGVELLVLSINILLAILFYKKYPKKFLLLSSVFWIGVFIVYVIVNIVNIPIEDDYSYFLLFLNNYSSTHDIHTIVQQEPHVESRLILMHLIGIVLFYLKAFNFKIPLFFSAVCLMGIALLFYRSIRAKQWVSIPLGKALLFLIIVILFFQFQYYNSIVYASSALYNTCTIFFIFCSTYLLNRTSLWTFILSLFFIFLSILNNGCGFIGIMCGTILLISQRRGKHLLIWIIFSILISIFYFTNYTFINDYIFSDFTSFIYTMYKCLVFSCVFLGSPFQFLYQDTLPMIIGGIIWLCLITLTLKRYHKKNPVIYFMLLFLIVTSCLPSPLLRSEYGHGHPYNIPLTIRYGIYAMVAACCCIIAFFETTNLKGRTLPVMLSFLIFSFLYHLSTNLFFYPEVVIRKERLITFIQHLKKGEPFSDTGTSYTKEEAKAIIEESVSKNIYRVPDE